MTAHHMSLCVDVSRTENARRTFRLSSGLAGVAPSKCEHDGRPTAPGRGKPFSLIEHGRRADARQSLAPSACGQSGGGQPADGPPGNSIRVQDSLEQPINCATAREEIETLEGHKVSKSEEAAVGLSYALPTTIFIGAITGTGGAKYDVGSGEYNRKIDERIADIRSTCRMN